MQWLNTLIMQDKLALLLKALVSCIFLISALGKLIDTSNTSLNIIQLFPLSPTISKLLVYFFSFVEIALAIFIWWHVSSLMLIIPVVFWGLLLISYFKKVDCGCFGSLPFFKDISIIGHFLLILGILLAFHYLSAPEPERICKATSEKSRAYSSWIGSLAISLLILAFFPFTFLGGNILSQEETFISDPSKYVGIEYVKAAIDYNSSIIIDARSPEEFQVGHISGALNIPHDIRDLKILIEQHELRTAHLIVYCSRASDRRF
ncbi:MAG: rhodanese-like domain-containing protein [bacterium]